jgi:hypothetical protein
MAQYPWASSAIFAWKSLWILRLALQKHSAPLLISSLGFSNPLFQRRIVLALLCSSVLSHANCCHLHKRDTCKALKSQRG